MQNPNLRNQLLWPTATKEFFNENADSIRSRKTRATYEDSYRALQQRHPHKRVNEFTEEDVVRFLKVDADGNARAWSSGTTRRHRTALCSFFGWAYYRGLAPVDYSVALKRRVSGKVTNVRRATWLTRTQAKALIETCAGDDPRDVRDAIVLELALLTGLRVFELAGLRWGDVDLASRRLSLTGKGAKVATVSLPVQLVERLTKWRSQYAIGLGRPVAVTDPVLCRVREWGYEPDRVVHERCRRLGDVTTVIAWGVPLQGGGIRALVKVRGASIGLPSLLPHDLRRTFAGLLLEGGKDVYTISKLLRHANLAVTTRYLQDSPSWLEDEVADLAI